MVTARRAAARIVDTLSGADRFSVLAFDNTIETAPTLPEGLVPATDRNRFRAIEHLARLEARGGTEMLAPLVRAAALLREGSDTDSADRERDRVLVLVTDGQVGNEDQILHELAPQLPGIRVHAVGIDVAVNEAFLRRIAALGGGHYELVESEDQLDSAMEAIHRRVGTPLVTDLRFIPAGLDILPESLTPTPLPALYAGAPLLVMGRYRGTPTGAVTVKGQAAGGSDWSTQMPVTPGTNTALAAVWARGRLRDLEDRYVTGSSQLPLAGEDPKALESQIIATSLRFGVLCRFTAYVAIDSRIVTDGGTPRRVTQPVEFPQGWDRESTFGTASLMPGGGAALMASAGPMGGGFAGPRRARLRPAAPARDMTGMPESAAQEFSAQPDLAGRERLEPSEVADVRRALNDELARLEQAPASKRPQHLADLAPRLAELLARLESAGVDSFALLPLRDLLADLRSYARETPTNAVEAERLWLRVLDVFRAFVAVNDWPSGNQPTVTSKPPRSKPSRGPGGSHRRTFWRRGS